jgi:hypothetical protein
MEDSPATIESPGRTFPIAFSLPVTEAARTLGAHYDDSSSHTAPYLQLTAFVLGLNRHVPLPVYRSGAVGRRGWQDVIGMVQYAKKSGVA